jgi:hypothetical protein
MLLLKFLKKRGKKKYLKCFVSFIAQGAFPSNYLEAKFQIELGNG